MTGRVRVRVLCEDTQHATFAHRVLKGLKVQAHDIRIIKNPGGEGAGEQFVRERYSQELEAHRVAKARRRAVLLVVIDADTRTVAATKQQLAEALEAGGQPARGPEEAVAILVPRRNIETWLHALEDGGGASEETRYTKRRKCESECQTAVDRFLALLRRGAEAPALPSLAEAVREMGPIVQALGH